MSVKNCTVCGTAFVTAKGLCNKCYARKYSREVLGVKACKIDGCEHDHHTQGFCREHHSREQVRKSKQQFEHSCSELGTLQNELKKLKEVYNLAVGLEARIRWSRKMTDIQAKINVIEGGTL